MYINSEIGIQRSDVLEFDWSSDIGDRSSEFGDRSSEIRYFVIQSLEFGDSEFQRSEFVDRLFLNSEFRVLSSAIGVWNSEIGDLRPEFGDVAIRSKFGDRRS